MLKAWLNDTRRLAIEFPAKFQVGPAQLLDLAILRIKKVIVYELSERFLKPKSSF
jgi:hypothetical protein